MSKVWRVWLCPRVSDDFWQGEDSVRCSSSHISSRFFRGNVLHCQPEHDCWFSWWTTMGIGCFEFWVGQIMTNMKKKWIKSMDIPQKASLRWWISFLQIHFLASQAVKDFKSKSVTRTVEKIQIDQAPISSSNVQFYHIRPVSAIKQLKILIPPFKFSFQNKYLLEQNSSSPSFPTFSADISVESGWNPPNHPRLRPWTWSLKS